MIFNPSSLNFIYKKYRTIPSETVVMTVNTDNFPVPISDTPDIPTFETPFIGSSDLFNVLYLGLDISSIQGERVFKYRITPKTQNLNNRNEGTYSDNIIFTHESNNLIRLNLLASVAVQDTIELTLSPVALNFEYTIDGELPLAKFISVISENNWSVLKTESWIQIDRLSGSNNGSIEVGVDPTGLPVGNYEGIIELDDGFDKIRCNILFQVKQQENNDQFLFVSPSTINLSEKLGEAPSSSRLISVDSSNSFEINANEAWLAFEMVSEASVNCRTVNTEDLPSGNHLAVIVVQSQISTRNIQVLLTITEETTLPEGEMLEALYYADDRSELKFNENLPDSDLVLETLTRSNGTSYAAKRRIPFFRGEGRMLLAQEAINLIEPIEFLPNLETRCFVPLYPLVQQIEIFDRTFGTGELKHRSFISDLKLMTGASPKISDRLTDVPEEVLCTSDGAVMFNFRNTVPPGDIIVTGAAEAIYNVPELKGEIFSCLVSLNDFNLSTGNIISILCGGQSLRVKIKPSQPEHTKVVWYNEWQLPELFIFTGYLEIINGKQNTLTQYAEKGLSRTVTVRTRTPVRYRLNSGFLTNLEVKWVSKIMASNRIFIEIDGVFTEVICTTRNMSLYETRRFVNAYLFDFEKAIV